MARPAVISHVENRTIQIATVETNELSALPALMKCYVALVEQVQKMGGEVRKNYGSVQLHIPKDAEQLKYQLEQDQAAWDRHSKLYADVLRGEVIKSYQEYSLNEWAKKEGLDAPVYNKEEEDADADSNA